MDASGAKSASLYVEFEAADADANVDVKYGHTARPPNWIDEATAMFTGTAVKPGMNISSGVTDVTRLDLLHFAVNVKKGTENGQVTVRMSIWLILEPF